MPHQSKEGSAKYQRLYPQASKRKSIPLEELAEGPIIGRSPESVKRYREGLKKSPPLRRGADY